MPGLRHKRQAPHAYDFGRSRSSVVLRIAGVALAIGLGAALIPQLSVQPASAPAGAGDGVARAGATERPQRPTPTPKPRIAAAESLRRVADRLEPPRPELLSGYVWPLPNGRLTQAYGSSPWGSKVVDGEPFHDGIDLATFCGDRIVAAHDGTVLAAGRRFDDLLGWRGDLAPYEQYLDAKKAWRTLPIVVVIDDGNGYRSVYAHFRAVVVEAGERVKAGDLLGYEGATGNASGCHLHWTMFSPWETATIGLEPETAKRMKLPLFLTARVDPMLVLPERPKPTPTPTPSTSSAPPS